MSLSAPIPPCSQSILCHTLSLVPADTLVAPVRKFTWLAASRRYQIHWVAH